MIFSMGDPSSPSARTPVAPEVGCDVTELELELRRAADEFGRGDFIDLTREQLERLRRHLHSLPGPTSPRTPEVVDLIRLSVGGSCFIFCNN